MLAAVLRRLVLTVNNVKCRKLRCLSLLIARPKLHSLLVSATLPGPASSNTSQLSYLRTPSMFIKSLKEEDVKYSGKLLGVERKRLSQGVASSFASSDGNDKHHEFGKEIGHNETDYDVTYNNGESGSFSYITSCSAMSDVVELNATEQVEVTYHGGSKNGRHHGNGTMSFSGGSTYTGEFQHGFKHGQGKYVSNSGTFEGEYRNGDLVKGSVHYRSGNVYEGEFRSYKPHGVGKHIRKSTGDVYEGQFVAGRQHGTGRITHPNGTSFEGTFRNSQVESGKGVFLFANKDTFEGEIAAGMMQGAGTLTEADGTVWRGNWSQGEKEGHFTITSSQQGDFHGLFINDRIFSGKGVIRLSDGSVFEGSWVDGMRDGAGSYSLCDGTVYQGVWARSCLEGEGKCITSTGTVLEGTWLNGALVKQFPQPESATPCGDEEASSSSGSRSARVKTIEFPDGSRYVGQTRNGRKHGQGVYKSKSGSIYEGEYTDDVATGQGVLTYANGSTYSGEFYAGSAHGYGVLRDAYSVCEGEFKHGKQHGVCTYTPHSSPTSSTTQEQQQKQEQEGESSCADNSSGGNSNTYTSSYKPISLGISNSSGGGHIKDIVRIIQRDSVYQGKYQHGRRHGQGTTVHASFRHVGEYYKGMARGPGAVYYPNGDVYEGEIKHFLPHKVGKHISADGTVYTGSWESGERHGKCEIFYPDGETFVGEYQRGEPYIGKGRCVFSNGDVFEGEMKLGKLTGSGSYTESGNIFIGSWENGVKHGRFQVTWSNGAVLRMLYNRGKVVSGKGVLFSEDGSKIIGQWAQGQLHGRCKITDAQGVTFEGEFKFGKRHGSGKTIQPDGSVEVSEWQQGRRKVDPESSPPSPPAALAPSSSSPSQPEPGQASVLPLSGEGAFTSTTSSTTTSTTSNANSNTSSSGSPQPEHAPSSTATKPSASTQTFAPPGSTLPASPPSPSSSSSSTSLTTTTSKAAKASPKATPFFSFRDGTAYQGEMRKGAKHGSGVFLTKEGHRIEGQWKEGHACGEMSAQYTNGDFYKGGIVRYLRHGHGCLTSVATGIKYIGNWSRGQRHGQGKLFGPKGELFMGQFKANKPYCGEGVLAYHNGDTFAGRYENGLKSGAGLYTSSGGAGGGGTTEGEWVLGKLEGDVTITYAVGGTFQGIYENNWMVCGSGVYYFPNGDRYDGVFVSGRKHGPGRYTDVRNGTVYDGEWVDGRREGYGIYTASDGYVYEGEWKDGMKEGRGVLWRDKDLVYEGLWVKNRPIS